MATSGSGARGAGSSGHPGETTSLLRRSSPGAEAESRDDQSATGKYVAGAVLFHAGFKYGGKLFSKHEFANHFAITGTIDDLRIYNRALSPDEVELLFQN